MGKTENDKKGFIVYYDVTDAIGRLSPEDAKDLWMALLSIGGGCDCPDLSPVAEQTYLFMKKTIERDTEKWEETRKRRAEAGRKGGLKKAENQNVAKLSNAKQSQANVAVNGNVNVNGNGNVNVNDNVNVNGNNTSTLIESGNSNHCAADAARRAGPSPPSSATQPPPSDVAAHFEALWSMYPHKRGKSAVSATTRRKLYTIPVATMGEAIDRYKAEVEAEGRKWLNGSTWFNGRYLDYYGDNYTPPPERTGGSKGSQKPSQRYVSKEGPRDFSDMEE